MHLLCIVDAHLVGYKAGFVQPGHVHPASNIGCQVYAHVEYMLDT